MECEQCAIGGPRHIHLHTVYTGVQSHLEGVHLKRRTRQRISPAKKRSSRNESGIAVIYHPPSWGTRSWSRRRARTPSAGSRSTRKSSRESGDARRIETNASPINAFERERKLEGWSDGQVRGRT